MESPLISIITINYNSLVDTLEFLETVKQTTYAKKEVFVIDNGSKDDPEIQIRSRFPDAQYIKSDKNLGFAGGNNLGISHSSGKYLFFLNNDTLIPVHFFEPIVAFLEENPDIGMASPKILYPDKRTIQYVGSIGINPITGRGKRIALLEHDNGQYDRCYSTDLAHGAALVVPAHVVNEVGAMPEEYFLYYEEHDWCEQIKRAGYKVFYIGTATILHKGSVSIGGPRNPLKVYYMTRNRLLFIRRNCRKLQKLLAFTFFAALTVPKQTLVFLLMGEIKLLSSFYRGIAWHLKN